MFSASRGILLVVSSTAVLLLMVRLGLGVSLLPGWPPTVTGASGASPALGDLDGDGDLEVVAGSADGVYAFHHDGKPVVGWPQSAPDIYFSSPALGDLDDDGDIEVVVGAGGSVSAWHHDGTALTGWPQTTGGWVWASPALGDVDRDGDLEVAMGVQGGQVYLWHHTGVLAAGWPKSGGGEESSPALADLDQDGDLEILVGSYDGPVYAWHHDGTSVTGWPQSTGDAIEGPVTLGDIDRNGDLEVLVGSWDFQVHAWHHTGAVVAGWPRNIGDGIEGAPVLGDVDGDSDIEVVVGSGDSKVYAWHHNGTPLAGWPQSTGDFVGFPPALGDLDGDGKLEIVCGSDDDKVYAWRCDGTAVAGWPQFTEAWGGGVTSPVIGDLDRDGDVEVVAAGGSIYAWTCDLPTADLRPWLVFHHDGLHTGMHRVRADPWANFSANPGGGAAPLTVSFTDRSTGVPTAWSWDFGDGGSSAEQNPTHEYAGLGTYTVGLAVRNAGGGSVATKREYIAVCRFADVPRNHWAFSYIEACVGAGIVGGYPDGTYHPEGTVTRDAMAVYISRALAGGDAGVPPGPATPSFSDVATDYWAYKYIEYAVAQGVVSGYWDQTYRPNLEVNRGAMAVFIARAMVGGDEYVPTGPATATFPDVPTDHWSYQYVEYCKANSVVGGYWDGTYRPDEVVNRGAMAVYVQRAFELPM